MRLRKGIKIGQNTTLIKKEIITGINTLRLRLFIHFHLFLSY